MRAVLPWAVVAVLAGAAAFELALALGAGSIGPSPGDGVAGDDAVRLGAVVAMVVAIGLAARSGGFTVELAPIAAAAFVAAAFYTYDPYFAPSLRRYSDDGAVPAWWIFTLVGITVANAAVSLGTRRRSRILTAAVLVLCLFTAVLSADGH